MDGFPYPNLISIFDIKVFKSLDIENRISTPSSLPLLFFIDEVNSFVL